MIERCVKGLIVAVFSLFCLAFPGVSNAQEPNTPDENSGKSKFDANEVVFGHVLDAHQFHFFTYKGSDGKEHHAVLPLPVILYSPQKGFSSFSSARFHHGEETYNGYRLVTEEYKQELKHHGYTDEQLKSFSSEDIIAVNAEGLPDTSVKVYDISLTRNVVQMFIALAIMMWLFIATAKKYRQGIGVKTAPKGIQNLLEPMVTFIRDDVAKPNLGHNYGKYMPYLLTVFFFILINNIFALVPGTANVTGNIAFTLILGLISFLVIMLSTNKHYWGHIFWPPVPLGVKFIMIPVEILGIFTKPVALIIRLFANMIAGHIIIICLISLIFIFGNLSKGIGWGFSPISVAFTVFIYFIEILVAFIQAYIFTNLTAVFIGQAKEDTHHAADDQHAAPTEPVII
jgi:F-type H+-transporting ATPase subunit a